MAAAPYGDYLPRMGTLNGQPAQLEEQQGQIVSAFVFAIVDGVIQNIFVMRNPDKLGRLRAISPRV